MKMESLNTRKTVYAICFAVIFILLAIALYDMRAFGRPVLSDMDDHFILKGQQETGANNIVTSVVFDYRGFDTLGEASVLFAAVLGVGVLFDWKKGQKKSKRDKRAKTSKMSAPDKTNKK